MGIVGTVDSAYKAIGAENREIDGAAMAGGADIAQEFGTPIVLSIVGPSADVRHPARCKRAAKDASMQRGWWCRTMGEERYEAQACAAARTAV